MVRELRRFFVSDDVGRVFILREVVPEAVPERRSARPEFQTLRGLKAIPTGEPGRYTIAALGLYVTERAFVRAS